ncbi:L-lactate dehydrogenase [Pseudomassariella vexata]|uniref:L-lactate dehydrogenase n=1 Tax=Pseudomassariella vexata TaxID=1141098 RepID=A0A1Y2DKT3_9PEZI|nr:L-lactate dehydrogenase [Pseudomassariella vexata]ORY59764.1 L-lactate dehydrogenase [Pseudomassariella vexata]
MAATKINVNVLKQHSNEDDGWVAINGAIWDVSGFASQHPGGEDIIKEYLGRDASQVYNAIHGPGLLASQLGLDKKIGDFDDDTLTATKPVDEAAAASAVKAMRPLEMILNMHDFEEVASQTLPEAAWAQISGATDDCFTKAANGEYYRRLLLRPRILEDVSRCDMSTEIFGVKFDLPIFNAPFASAKLVHPEGELALARGLAAMGTTMMIPTLSSFSVDEIVSELPPAHPFFFQLYVYSDRNRTEALLRQVVELKATAIMLTVDLPVMSKRESIQRYKAKVAASKPPKTGSAETLARGSNGAITCTFQWSDIQWLKDLTRLPIVLKGIQCAADAKKALDYGCGGIYLSNHGGRALDTAPPCILTLMEIQADCPEVLEKMEVFIDGGIRRGTDILKAICLGASAVCLGRPFFYAATYGDEGVKHAVDILSDELRVAMQLSGITSLSQAHPGLVNTTALDPYVHRGQNHPWARKIVRSRL